MTSITMPRSLRTFGAAGLIDDALEANATRKITIGWLMAVASITAAEAQEQLPPVKVEAPPVARKRHPTTKPTPEELRVRAALRRAARARQAARARATPTPAAAAAAPDQNPYADPAAPYKANLLASPKFTMPIVDTPKSVTVLTKELLEDKGATSLKEVARTTAGVTLGTGEGGNAFGDRFFIRGFDARNDVFVDGIRDPAVNIRENFFTEQIEILKGPSSIIDGRGTTGGALNIVTKQASTATSFYNADSTLASDNTKRVTFDVNQVITPTLAIRIDGMWQNANVSERDFTFDDRWGGLAAVKWTPTSTITITANYIHSSLNSLPDFGVPYDVAAQLPVTSVGVPRDTYYGFLSRDFQKAQQDIGTVTGEFRVNDFVTVNNRFRDERSVLNYIGTIPEQPVISGPNPATWTTNLNPQSRYQVTDILADQSSATIKFGIGPLVNTIVTGIEVSREGVSIDSYSGTTSEAVGSSATNGVASYANASILYPPNSYVWPPAALTGNPNVITVDTTSAFVMETANFRDLVILNGGVRFDQYDISAAKTGYPTISAANGMWNYNLGAVVKPLPFGSVYVAYGTASQPIGAELDGVSTNYGGLSPTSPISQIFGPIESRAEEVGTKWELFDRHLLATAALFRTDVSNARELVGSSTSGTITAGAAYHVQGVDFGAQGNITDKWSIYSGLVLMNTKVDQSAVPSNIGLPLAFVANQSFNVLTKYKINPYLEVGGQATYRSQIYGGTLLAANQGTVLPDYWRFDVFIEGYIFKNFEWKVFVNNVFNKLYYDAFYQSGAPFVLVAPGRVEGIMLTARF